MSPSTAMDVDNDDVNPQQTLEQQQHQILQEKVINEEYKVWKKNAPYLYDVVVTHALEWPSLTCQWFNDIENPEGKDYSVQRLLLGTHTSEDAPNYVQIATLNLPNHESEPPKYNEDRGAYGGHGAGLSSQQCKFAIKQRIPHSGEVNRARWMPQNPFIIATKNVCGHVNIFDYTKHSLEAEEGAEAAPDLTLVGQAKEGYGLAWSPINKGWIASGSEDATVAVWNIADGGKDKQTLEPRRIYKRHTAFVEDVAWHWKSPNVLASVGDDSSIFVWDIREESDKEAKMQIMQAHKSEINCCAFNAHNEYLLATGGSDKIVALWDMRKFGEPLHRLEGHEGEILQIAWSPHDANVLASAGGDRRVNVWDLSRIGSEQDPEDAEDGPPELLFVHGGHTAKVSDISWNANEPWMLASVAEDNICQIWKPTSAIYQEDEEEGDSDVE